MVYLHYPNAAAIDEELTRGQSGPPRDTCYDHFAEGAYRARARFRNALDLRYGKGDRQRIDFFWTELSPESAPTVIFFHGGGWRLSDKFFANFYAEAFCPEGINVALCGYGLSPLFTVGQIMAQARDAVGWVQANTGDLGIDPSKLVIAGNSAGAHLAAGVLTGDPSNPLGLRGAVLFSGLYDLQVLYHSKVYASLSLSETDAYAWSPQFQVSAGLPPALLLYGGDETDEFKRQSLELERAWTAVGNAAESVEIEGTDHFSSQWNARTAGTAAYERMIAFIQSCID
ncbi:MAG: alpha/beta hydrolase [Opitutales bacterium]